MMEPNLSKDAILQLVVDGLRDAETAIRNHPPETVAVYERGAAGFRAGQELIVSSPVAQAHGLSIDELHTINRYLFAMAFISAWYHLYGDKAQRDKAAQSASTVVAGTGLDAKLVFLTMLDYERNWRESLRSAGVAGSSGCASVLLFACMSVIFLWI